MADEALAEHQAAAWAPVEEFQREHLRALSSKLVEKVRELEATERALGESVARFRSLAESCPLGILSLDSAAQVTYTNPRLQQITGIADHHLPRPIWSE